MLTEFGKELRKARIDLDIRAKEMARALGVSPSYLSAVENGKKKVSARLLENVIDCLQLDLDGDKELRRMAREQNAEMPSSVPEGYALVPKQMTPEMEKEFYRMHNEHYHENSPYRGVHTWNALLRAAGVI